MQGSYAQTYGQPGLLNQRPMRPMPQGQGPAASLMAFNPQPQAPAPAAPPPNVGPSGVTRDSLYGRLSRQSNTPLFNAGAWNQGLESSAANQRGAVNDIYNTSLPQQTNAYNASLAPQRSNLVNEMSARGIMTSPAANASLDRFETGRSQGLSDIVSNLNNQRNQGLMGVEQNLSNNLMRGNELGAQYGLAQGGQQQSGLLGLLGSMNQEDTLTNQINQWNKEMQLNEHQFNENLGAQNRLVDASKPNDWQNAGAIMQGLGSIGQATAGGYSAYKGRKG